MMNNAIENTKYTVMKTIKPFVTLALLAVVNAPSLAATVANETNTKIEEITQMLQENPEVVDNLHQSLMAFIAQQQGIVTTLQRYQPHVNSAAHSAFGAMDDPQLTIINVTDYNCPYCKKLDRELEKLAKAYPQIKVVNIYTPLKEYNGPLEYNTASYALNVWRNMPDSYQQVHDLLVANPRMHSERTMKAIAEKTGTQSQLVQSKVSDELLERNQQFFSDLGLRGTPALVINDQIIPGYLPYPELEKVLKAQLNPS
ncbi:DsbA family protein [Vibrio methylphosphonaticus]|uniref:DsbA family protein n=1 Tax=Vibrio methylphosphonaticus TaxID=2946866 RepID=UPI002029CBCF|nr:DsbA family protein [Vibrio methylphosphonaticus]MCL9774225.1 DsbA family protein [Vibrio methylphosphonaticus]